MAKTILFDFGGVLGSEAHDWGGALLPVTDATGLSTGEMEGLWSEFWPALSVGAVEMAAFWETVYRVAPSEPEPGTLELLFERASTVDPDVIAVAEDLKRHGFRLAILANESQAGMDVKIKKHRLADLFERVYCSASVGVAKPDEAIFRFVLHDLAVPPDEVIAIDDRSENIAAAMAVGMHAIRYQNPAELRADLERTLAVPLHR